MERKMGEERMVLGRGKVERRMVEVQDRWGGGLVERIMMIEEGYREE